MKITAKTLAAEEKRLQSNDLALQIEIVRRLRPEIEATAARLVKLIGAHGKPVSEEIVKRICREIGGEISAEARWRLERAHTKPSIDALIG